MILTKEQFTNLGEFHIDDFPIDSTDQDFMFRLFNSLPDNIQVLLGYMELMI